MTKSIVSNRITYTITVSIQHFQWFSKHLSTVASFSFSLTLKNNPEMIYFKFLIKMSAIDLLMQCFLFSLKQILLPPIHLPAVTTSKQQRKLLWNLFFLCGSNFIQFTNFLCFKCACIFIRLELVFDKKGKLSQWFWIKKIAMAKIGRLQNCKILQNE